jgi:phage/plasmid primase-like uncharacterized protein
MDELLESLGFELNPRTRRAPCILHAGKNPTAFSWNESGLWKCHACGAGGDKIALVRAARRCNFTEAKHYLATLAGVELEQSKPSRADTERLERERQAEERAARLLADAEHDLLLELASELRDLRRLRRTAATRLAAGIKPELCWEALKFVADTLRRADAAYCISAFAAALERARFALHPELRPAMIDAALELGFLTNAKGYQFEVPLQ